MSGLAVAGIGMVTSVGLDAPASCAAIRCAVENFQETRFRDKKGQWLLGAEVPLTHQWRGSGKLLRMAAQSTRECLSSVEEVNPGATPLIVCLGEAERPGGSVTDAQAFISELEQLLGQQFHAQSCVIARGHVSAAVAIHHARVLLSNAAVENVLVVAADTLLSAATIKHFEARHRLLTSVNSDGFIPGDAGSAFLLRREKDVVGPRLVCRGIGFAIERAHIDSEEPLRADALASAIRDALTDASWPESVLKFKIVDVAGSQYYFKEASLAFSRIDRTKRTEFDIWHPADCVGEVGAAIGPIMIGVLKTAYEKNYAKGDHVLMHLGNDDGKRAALVFNWQLN